MGRPRDGGGAGGGRGTGSRRGLRAGEDQVPARLALRGAVALFLLAKAKGYFAQEKLDVEIDAGSGSGNAVNRVASGAYQMGFADLAALIEFVGNNPTAPEQAGGGDDDLRRDAGGGVLAQEDRHQGRPRTCRARRWARPCSTPAAGRSRSSSRPTTSTRRRSRGPRWTRRCARPCSLRGDVDAITGFYFTSLLNLNARGVKDEDIDVMMYPQHGVDLYSNAIIVSEPFLKEKPEAVRGVPARDDQGRCATCSPIRTASIRYVKERDALVDEALEKRRMRLAIASAIAHADREGRRRRRRAAAAPRRHGRRRCRARSTSRTRSSSSRSGTAASCRRRPSAWCSPK